MAVTTTKKVKVIGQQEYINAETGELESFSVTSIEDRDFNFHKVWMRNFISTLDIVGNQKTRLCMWIVDHINKENQLIGTMRGIADSSGMSLETVRVTMKILLDVDFLRRVQNGVYIVNPDIVYKGSYGSRMNILNQYSTAERVKMTDEEQLAHLMDSIKALTAKADAIRKRIEAKGDDIEGQVTMFDILEDVAV